MSETKWPLGPYEISHEPPRWIIQAEQEMGKKALAWMVGDYLECRNVAHLFAASPSLYAALERLVLDVADYPAWQRPCAALDEARAALAQARGETT